MVGWLQGWNYRKSHVINPSSGAGTGYQIKITVHYGSGADSGSDVYLNGKCNTDFSDIRFTDSSGSVLLPYWIESYTPSDNAVIWVKINDDLSTNPATIYIYYGNPNATSLSNGQATFDFFDDFNTLDTSVWNVLTGSGGSVSVSNSLVKLDRANIITKTYILTDGIIEYRGYSASKEISGIFRTSNNTAFDVFNATGTVGGHGFYSDSSTPSWSHAIAVSNTIKASVGSPITIGKWYKFRAVLVGTQITFTRFDDDWIQEATVSYNNDGGLTSGYIGFRVDGTGNGDRVAYYDWIRVRKYVSPEPTQGAWGSEEIYATQISSSDSGSGIDSIALRVLETNDSQTLIESVSYLDRQTIDTGFTSDISNTTVYLSSSDSLIATQIPSDLINILVNIILFVLAVMTIVETLQVVYYLGYS